MATGGNPPPVPASASPSIEPPPTEPPPETHAQSEGPSGIEQSSNDSDGLSSIPPPLPASATLRKRRWTPARRFGIAFLCVGLATAVGILLDHRRDSSESDVIPTNQSVPDKRFNPSSYRETAAWASNLASVLASRWTSARGNALAAQTIQDEHQAANDRLNLLNGTRVHWAVPVHSVSPGYVILDNFRPTAPEKLGFLVSRGRAEFGLTFGDFPRGAIPGSFLPHAGPYAVLKIGSEIDRRQAETLRPGDKLPIEGEVARISLADQSPYPDYLLVELTDVSAR